MPEARWSSTYRRSTRTACAIAAAMTLVLLGAPMLFGMVYFGIDLDRSDLGILCEIRGLLERGAPLWLSPHMGNGAPLLPRPPAQLFYPPGLLSLLLPIEIGLSLRPILHLTLGAAATCWLARTFRVRPVGAIGAGLVFAFSGTAIDLILHSQYIVAAAWLPLIWAAARRWLGPRGGRTELVLLGAGAAAMLLGGAPQGYGVAVALVCYEVVRRLRSRRIWPRAGVALATMASGFLLGMLQWLPFFSESRLTDRSATLAGEEALSWSFSKTLWLASLWPSRVLVDQETMNNFWMLLQGDVQKTVWNPTPYLGPLFIVVLVCAASMRRCRHLTLVALLFLGFALGNETPLLPSAMELFPPLAMFRYPQKYLLAFNLAALMLVATYVQAMARNRLLLPRLLWGGGTMLLFHGILYLATWSIPETVEQPANTQLQQLMGAAFVPLPELVRPVLAHASVPLLGCLVVLALWPRWRPAGLYFIWMDLLLATTATLPVGAPLADLVSPIPTVLRAEATGRAPAPVICHPENATQNTLARPGNDVRWDQIAMYRIYDVPELNACDGVIAAIPYTPLRTSLNVRLGNLVDHMLPQAVRALGCTHIISAEPPTFPDFELVPFRIANRAIREFLEAGSEVYRITDPIPELFVAHQAALAASEDEVMQGLALNHTATQALQVVDDPIGNLRSSTVLPDGAGAATISGERQNASQITLQVGGTGGAVVGVRTSFQVGWHAFQANQELPVVRVSGQHVGAVVTDVSAGPIAFRYRPPLLNLALACGAGGILLLAGLVTWAPGRRSRAS